MSIRNRLAIALMTFLVPVAFAGTASAAAGDACAGTVCGLGGQLRAQIGFQLALPISIAPAGSGPFTRITMQTQPATANGLPLRGNGLGQPGQIKPTALATIMQTTAMLHTEFDPRKITLPVGNAGFDALVVGEGSIGVVAVNAAVFAVQTNLVFDNPHPGTDGFGNPVSVPGGGGSRQLSADGRKGGPTVTFCMGSGGPGGNINNNFNNACITPADGDFDGINGIVRYTKTKNQFGGVSTGRTLGTVKVFFNKDSLLLNQLPCTGCEFQISEVPVPTKAVFGGPFGTTVMNAAFTTPSGVYTGTVGFNGTILNIGNLVTMAGVGIPFTGQAATSVGFPLTTGKITISVTAVFPGEDFEIFRRTGTDARDANGNGVVALNAGTMSARFISKGNANRTWVTLEIPEPSAIFAASAGLFALFGCHQLVRRRSR